MHQLAYTWRVNGDNVSRRWTADFRTSTHLKTPHIHYVKFNNVKIKITITLTMYSNASSGNNTLNEIQKTDRRHVQHI